MTAIRGSIDSFENSGLTGWIDNPNDIRPLVIDVFINGSAAFRGVVADTYREDLALAHIGGGRRGFHVPLKLPKVGGRFSVSVHLSGEQIALLSRDCDLSDASSIISSVSNGIIEGFIHHENIIELSSIIKIGVRLNNIDLMTSEMLLYAGNSNRVNFAFDLSSVKPAARRSALNAIAKAKLGATSGLLVLTLSHNAGGQHLQQEISHSLSDDEILDVEAYLQTADLHVLENALLIRKALEASGLWRGTPLRDADIDKVKHDPALLCLDPVHFRSIASADPQGDTLSEMMELFRNLSASQNLTPNLLFSETWYRRQSKNIAQSLTSGDARSGLDHYLDCGLSEGVLPHEELATASHGSFDRDFLTRLAAGERSNSFDGDDSASWSAFVNKLKLARPREGATLLGSDLNGKDVVVLNTNTHTRNIHITRAIIDDARSIFGEVEVHLATYDNVVEMCAELATPILLCLDGQRLSSAILERAISHCSASCLWTFDDPYNLSDHINYVDLFDQIFTNDRSSLAHYGDKGFFLPLAAPSALLGETLEQDPAFDIFFCGMAWPNRVTLLNRLLRDRPQLRFKIALTYNSATPRLPLNASLSSYVETLSFADYIKYAKRSRVTLALHRNFSGTDKFATSSNPGPRVFEIGAAGAYQVAEFGGEDFEALIPSEYLHSYSSYEELLDLIDTALNQPAARKASAENLRKLIAAQHSYRHRIAAIATELNRVLVSREIPSCNEPRELPRLLYVVHNTINAPPFGGLEVHQDILAQNLKEKYEIYFFYTVRDPVNGQRAVLADVNYQELSRSKSSFSIDHGNLENPQIESFFATCLSTYDFNFVHFFQFINHTASLAHISRAHGVPYGISLHDFYTACREFNLLDHTGRFCQNDYTKLVDCDICLHKRFKFPPKSQLIRRDYFGDVLGRASTLMYVSESAKDIHEQIYPQLARHNGVRVHGAPIPNSQWPLVKSARMSGWVNETLPRFVVLGNFTTHKGANYLLDALMVQPNLEIEIHFHGSISEDLRARYEGLLGSRAVFHGSYAPGEVDLRRYDFSLHLSIWPETYCQTLSEAWAAGIVPIVTDIGALGQRVSHGINGYKSDPLRPATLATLLMDIASDPRTHLLPRKNISSALFLEQPRHAQLYDEAYRAALATDVNRRVKKPAGAVKSADGATMDVLQRKRRTPFWNRGKGGHPVTSEYLPNQNDLVYSGRLKPFSGVISYAANANLDTATDQMLEQLGSPLILKNSDELYVAGWVDKSGLTRALPVAVLTTSKGIYRYTLDLQRRPDVANVFPGISAEEWGMQGHVRLLTPEVMIVGQVNLSIGWYDKSAESLRIGHKSIQILGKFGG
ncbi:glycosyltransferase family protein [Neorhizobium sp. IRS_2294]|uniref:glycosyltransferase family protein n=1 Tax=unclassified Neorhizobium TaxID=2629175 RepID=UPI003D2C9BD5